MYDADPASYHRGMSSLLTQRVLAGRRRRVGEMVRGRLLDVGFGTGLSLPYYPSDVEVIGIDVSSRMLEFGRRQAAAHDRQVGLVAMDAAHLGFPDHCFDSVAFNLCLCTIPDPVQAVREAIRVARPGAPMVFLEHVRSHLLPVALVQEALSPLLVALEEDHWNRRTVDIVRRAGVQVETVDRWLLGIFNLIRGRAPAQVGEERIHGPVPTD
jgi:ubiquinone/menaquinone biosynthesis C-methylase UbiE